MSDMLRRNRDSVQNTGKTEREILSATVIKLSCTVTKKEIFVACNSPCNALHTVSIHMHTLCML